MSEYFAMVLMFIPALLEGILLGLFFFTGLWWTVRKIKTTSNPALLFMGSMLVRVAIVVLGFYLILGDNWQNLVTGLFGFILARIIITKYIGLSLLSDLSIEKTEHEY